MWPFKKKPVLEVAAKAAPMPEVWEFWSERAVRAAGILGACERRLVDDGTLLKICDKFLEAYEASPPVSWCTSAVFGGYYTPFKYPRGAAANAVQAERDRIAHRVAVAEAARAVEKVALARERLGLPNRE